MASSSSSGNQNSRTIVVSNRLPYGIKLREGSSNTYDFEDSSGGLVTAFSGLGISFTWMGWPDIVVSSKNDQENLKTQLSNLPTPCLPIWVDKKQGDDYYNGFSNGFLWPYLHGYPSTVSQSYSTFWKAYEKVNEVFANAINAQLKDGDLVWIQDYHLMLVPQKLRKLIKKKNVKIGWFLHTPFPTNDYFRQIKDLDTILRAILHADLIGFHTEAYAGKFLGAFKDNKNFRDLSITIEDKKIKFGSHTAQVSVFPAGINPNKFTDSLKNEVVKKNIEMLKAKHSGAKIILGIDRLDYIKGIPQKLDAMKMLLSKPHDKIGKVVLIQIAVKTRQDVEEYKQLRADVEKQVNDINESHPGAIEFTYGGVDHELLVALYAVSDACLVTSTRDGMNLVAYEFIASQQEKHGVLLLSKYTGASDFLNGAYTIDPYDFRKTAEIIGEALTVNDVERNQRYKTLWDYVRTNTAEKWGNNFLGALRATG